MVRFDAMIGRSGRLPHPAIPSFLPYLALPATPFDKAEVDDQFMMCWLVLLM
jgi:hypothetical protein